MTRRSRCDHEVLTTYRVLSAASGRDVVNTRSLGAALGLPPKSLLMYLGRLGLPTNPRGAAPRAAARGIQPSRSIRRRLDRTTQPGRQSLGLDVLRTARALEACSGRGANQAAVARACGTSRQRVHQILAELEAPSW